MIQNLLSNWRTTSAGLLTILGAIVNLVFAIKNHVDDQGTWMICFTQVLTGLGLMFSRDQAQSRADKESVQSQIADLKQNTVTAIKSGNTEMLTKADVANPPKPA